MLFIDEIDSVIGSRRHGDGKKSVQERVLSTLLNEMDGIGIKTDDLVRSGDKVAKCEQHPELQQVGILKIVIDMLQNIIALSLLINCCIIDRDGYLSSCVHMKYLLFYT